MHVGRAQESYGVLREETGLEIEIAALLSVASNFLRPEIHTLAVAVLAKPVGGAICPGDDVDELGWFPLETNGRTLRSRPIVTWWSATLPRASPGAPVDLASARQV